MRDSAQLPRLAVFLDEYTPSMYELFEASLGLCRLVWIVGSTGHISPIRALSKFGDVVDVLDMDEAERVNLLISLRPAGVAVFSDGPQLLAAHVAAELDLPFHSPHTARLLTDKLAQRTALQAAGGPVPAFALVRSGEVGNHFPFPAVLKPQSGTGGRDTFKVHDLDQVAEKLARCNPDEEFILEEWLPDRTTPHGLAADLVSVESVAYGGVIHHMAVTGRFPFAPPFRETGLFLPSDLSAARRDAVLAVAGAAIDALRVHHGFLHTEIKMTPDGPRIVEINGRLGGGISGLVSRLGGPDLFERALRLALGKDPEPFPVLPENPIAFYLYFLPPPSATVVESVTGMQALRTMAGVDQAQLNRRPGDAVSSQESGHLGYVIRIDGTANSHAELAVLCEDITTAVEVRFV
jgi:biotin carboxylase